ncbi:hypothetical protein DY000_02006638 [Brassica cretica]|uniref:Remorin C-terminal domain-containing protein n=1 Tax=Brassica cretica TaxID=69181 RepID=A0ABQ7CBZ7_BRACR|nr:hypothetical protein DY000_02006638 [Brassica cretica]
MEDMDFGQTSIDKITTTSSDVLTETSVDAILQTSVDESTETSIYDTPPEAGKFSLTNHANEEVVLVEKIGESRSRPILRDNPDPGSEPSREKVRSNTGKSEEATINLDEKEEESEEDEEIDRQEGYNVDRTTTEKHLNQTVQVALEVAWKASKGVGRFKYIAISLHKVRRSLNKWEQVDGAVGA